MKKNHKDENPHRFHGLLKTINADGSAKFTQLCECHKTDRVLIDPKSPNQVSEIQAGLDLLQASIDAIRREIASFQDKLMGDLKGSVEEAELKRIEMVGNIQVVDDRLTVEAAKINASVVELGNGLKKVINDNLELVITAYKSSVRKHDALGLELRNNCEDILNRQSKDKEALKLQMLNLQVEVDILRADLEHQKNRGITQWLKRFFKR